MQYHALIIDFWETDDAYYYKLQDKIPLQILLQYTLTQKETRAQAEQRWPEEVHWLADWDKIGSPDLNGRDVVFEMKSSRYYSKIKHREMLYKVRNINISQIASI